MNLTLENFLKTLLDGESTCFSPDALGTEVSTKVLPTDLFFSINALNPTTDLAPSQPYHNVNRPRRADVNVTCFRNFLIEIDTLPLDQQIEYVTSKVPVTSIVYSGGKSYHFIISLEAPVLNIEQYQVLAKRLHKLLPLADKSTKNPSRFSRLPFRTRPETGLEQKLVQLNTRVANETLLALLPEVATIKYNSKPDSRFISVLVSNAVSNPEEAMSEMDIKSRNGLFYWLGQRLADLELEMESRYNLVERAYSNLQNTKGFDLNEALSAARLK